MSDPRVPKSFRINMVIPLLAAILKDRDMAEKLESRMFMGSPATKPYLLLLQRVTFVLSHKEFKSNETLSSASLAADIMKFRAPASIKIHSVLRKEYNQQCREWEEKRKARNEMAESGILKCHCGSFDVEWAPMQTRGGDEGSTVLCKCNVCNVRWSISN